MSEGYRDRHGARVPLLSDGPTRQRGSCNGLDAVLRWSSGISHGGRCLAVQQIISRTEAREEGCEILRLVPTLGGDRRRSQLPRIQACGFVFRPVDCPLLHG